MGLLVPELLEACVGVEVAVEAGDPLNGLEDRVSGVLKLEPVMEVEKK